jgi:hypothetical protein
MENKKNIFDVPYPAGTIFADYFYTERGPLGPDRHQRREPQYWQLVVKGDKFNLINLSDDEYYTQEWIVYENDQMLDVNLIIRSYKEYWELKKEDRKEKEERISKNIIEAVRNLCQHQMIQ